MELKNISRPIYHKINHSISRKIHEAPTMISGQIVVNSILLEIGDPILLETGDELLLEDAN